MEVKVFEELEGRVVPEANARAPRDRLQLQGHHVGQALQVPKQIVVRRTRSVMTVIILDHVLIVLTSCRWARAQYSARRV